MPIMKNIKMIACGANHSVCLSKEGEIYTFGLNRNGELGRTVEKQGLKPEIIPNFRAKDAKLIACGKSHSFLINRNGELFAWGSGARGVCGTNSIKDLLSPTKITLPGNAKALHAAAGWAHSVVVSEDGQLFACGSRNDGKLGF